MKEFSKKLQKQLDNYRRKVESFNDELTEYKNITGSYELPTIDCTFIGYEELRPYKIKNIKNGFVCEADGIKMNVVMRFDEDGEEYISGWESYYDGLKESLTYDKRRLAKGWKVWHSDNPDAELEKDDEE